MPEPAPEPSLFGRSKTNKNTIPITMDVNGKPEIPSVTVDEGYHAKIIQSTLQEYCTAHIREYAHKFGTCLIIYLIQDTLPER
jgi:hypothetical protein